MLDNLGRSKEAVECYDKAIEINPGLVEAWNNKGVALGNLSRYQEAIISFRKFIEIALPPYNSHVGKVEEVIRLLGKNVDHAA